jgi:nitrile hydratase accessory protein
MNGPMRPGATELADARRRVEELVCGLPGSGGKPFEEPWELRAFAIAVAAYQNGHYDWSEFQLSLIEAIRRWEKGHDGEPWSYYEHWLEALESVLAGKGALPADVLDERTRTVLATPRNANHHTAHREPVSISPARVG